MLYNDQNYSGGNGNPPSGGYVPPQQPQQYYPPQQPQTPPIHTGYGGPAPVNPPVSQPAFPGAVKPGVSDKIPDRKSVATKMIELVYLMLIILESVLALRFIFKLLGADEYNVFIQFLYNMTMIFVVPFQGLFATSAQNTIRVSLYNLEFTTLVAMGIYALLAYIVVRIIDIFR
ncbi:MAG: YggT family protein [bacterium]|nr:YggT family protein [bacterium]